MRADWVDPAVLEHILAALTPENELVMRVALATGLRVGDVLSIKTSQIVRGRRFTVREQKTGKTRRVYIPEFLYTGMLRTMGRYYVFEGRTDPRKPRTRQAVWKDLRRAAKLFRISEAVTISPHTARKVYAVDAYQRSGSAAAVQRMLNHGDEAVTMLYIMADEVTRRKLHGSTDPRRGRQQRSKDPPEPRSPSGEGAGGEAKEKAPKKPKKPGKRAK